MVCAVEVAGKIEQKDLEQHDAAIEHRPAAEIGNAVVAASAVRDAHRIDAVAQPAGSIEPEVRGRESRARGRACRRGSPRRKRTRESRAARPRRPARPAASASRIGPDETGRPSSSKRRHHIDGKAELAALRRKEIRRAGAVLAEMEVEADHGPAHAEPLDQDVARRNLPPSGSPAPRRRSARSRRRARSTPAAAIWRSRRSAETAARRDGRRRADAARRSAPRPACRALRRAPSRPRSRPRWPRCTPSKLPMATTAPRKRAIGRAIAHDEEAFRRHRGLQWLRNLRGRWCRRGCGQVKPGRQVAEAWSEAPDPARVNPIIKHRSCAIAAMGH